MKQVCRAGSFDWDYYTAILRRYYHLDPYTLTFDGYFDLLMQAGDVRAWEAGKPTKHTGKSSSEGLSPDEWAEAVMRGEIKPDVHSSAPPVSVPADPVAAYNLRQREMQLLRDLGVDIAGLPAIPMPCPVPASYGTPRVS